MTTTVTGRVDSAGGGGGGGGAPAAGGSRRLNKGNLRQRAILHVAQQLRR